MEKLKIEAGKFYRLRNGQKAFVAGLCPFERVGEEMAIVGFIENDTDCIGGWGDNGRWYKNRESPQDIVAEWVEPKRIKGWLNVNAKTGTGHDAIADVGGGIWPTKALADSVSGCGRIACIEIDVLEGQGLDGSAR